MDIDIENATEKIKKEMNEFIDITEKVKKLAPEAKSIQEKETVNSYIEAVEKHYITMINLINEMCTSINESNEYVYELLKEASNPNVELPPLHKLTMLEPEGKLIKLIIDED